MKLTLSFSENGESEWCYAIHYSDGQLAALCRNLLEVQKVYRDEGIHIDVYKALLKNPEYCITGCYDDVKKFRLYLAVFDTDVMDSDFTTGNLIIDGAYRTTYDPANFEITKIEN